MTYRNPGQQAHCTKIHSDLILFGDNLVTNLDSVHPDPDRAAPYHVKHQVLASV